MVTPNIKPFDVAPFIRSTGLAFGGAIETAGKAFGGALQTIGSPEYKLAEEKLKEIQQGKIKKAEAINIIIDTRVEDTVLQQKIYGTRDKMVDLDVEERALFEETIGLDKAPTDAGAPRSEAPIVEEDLLDQTTGKLKPEAPTPKPFSRVQKRTKEDFDPVTGELLTDTAGRVEKTVAQVTKEEKDLRKNLRKQLEQLTDEEIKDYQVNYAEWIMTVRTHKQDFGNLRQFVEPSPKAVVSKDFIKNFKVGLKDWKANKLQDVGAKLVKQFEKTPEAREIRKNKGVPNYEQHFVPWVRETFGDVSKQIDAQGNPVDDAPELGIANGLAMKALADPKVVKIFKGEFDTFAGAESRRLTAERTKAIAGKKEEEANTKIGKEVKTELTSRINSLRDDARSGAKKLPTRIEVGKEGAATAKEEQKKQLLPLQEEQKILENAREWLIKADAGGVKFGRNEPENVAKMIALGEIGKLTDSQRRIAIRAGILDEGAKDVSEAGGPGAGSGTTEDPITFDGLTQEQVDEIFKTKQGQIFLDPNTGEMRRIPKTAQ